MNRARSSARSPFLHRHTACQDACSEPTDDPCAACCCVTSLLVTAPFSGTAVTELKVTLPIDLNAAALGIGRHVGGIADPSTAT
jgi:hypothetical protein